MLDPFQEQYGRWMGLLLCLPAVCGEIFWTAAMLSALEKWRLLTMFHSSFGEFHSKVSGNPGFLGDTAGAMMDVDSKLFIVIAATTIFFYTALGGQYSVAYTDVFQLCITIVFMWICVPYVMKGRAVGTVRGPETDWVGKVSLSKAGQLLDDFLMTALGGIPWQVYFQCVLGSNSDFAAEMLSYVAALGCVFMAVPPMVIGATAKTTNFTAAGYPGPWQLTNRATVLPQTIRFVTPALISILGMLAIISAVMSSADSSMFSASTMLTKNVYHELLRPNASEGEVAITLRVVVCLFGAAATYLALSVESVFGLWTLCSDVVYVLLFPQLVGVFYIKDTNTYGSIIAFVLGAFVRWLCGEPSLNLSASLHLSLTGREREEWFPFRLACMAICFLALIGGSMAADLAFENKWLPPHYDIFGCYRESQPGDTTTRRNESLWIREHCAEDERGGKTCTDSAKSELSSRSERTRPPSGRSLAASMNVTEMTTRIDRGRSNPRRKRRNPNAAAAAAPAKTTLETADNKDARGKQKRRSAKQGSDETMRVTEMAAPSRPGTK
ncbi:high-affinity choline transporter 1-like [Rhipicephalus microplus]|uniref:high-affinity choline transporter 1-like n=1 Tax=Rhipicephalus microplus TaxID=6941 RepID=UPI003F6CC85B